MLSPIVIWSLVALFTCYICHKINKLRIFLKRADFLPGPKKESLLMGNANILREGRRMGMNPGLAIVTGATLAYKSSVEFVKNGFVRIWIGPFPMIGIMTPELAEVILSSNSFIDKADQYHFFHDWLGDGLLNSSGSKWRSRRKMLTPSFHFNILEDFIPTMKENTKLLLASFEKERLSNPDHIIYDIGDLILKSALDIICETAMGVKVNAQTNPKNEYIESVNSVGIHLIDRMVTPLFYIPFFWNQSKIGKQSNKSLKLMHDFTLDVIAKKKQEFLNQQNQDKQQRNQDQDKKKRFAFMDTLILEQIKNPNLLTDEDIRAEVDTFMFEGHDTTGWGVTWATYLLGQNPDVQDKVFQEIQDVIGDNEITIDNLRSLKYLECVIKEAQRLFPSVPFIGRKHDSDFDLGNGFILPAGIQVGIFIYQIHRDPNHWPNPEKFDPDRFLSHNSIKRHPFSSIHFSAGPRNCIGQKFAMLEEKSLLVNIIRKYKVISLKNHEQILGEISPSMILRCETNLPVKLVLR